MQKRDNSKGFTLMEMLIVVAIIAILVAIAIPVFSTQLEKAREATDFANVRAAYAEVMTCAITNDTTPDTDTGVTYSSGTWTATVAPLAQTVDGWATDTANLVIGGVKAANWTGSPKKSGKCTITYDGANAAIKW